MSFFGPPIKYSQQKHALTTQQVDLLMQHIHSSNIDLKNKADVEQAILNRRYSDGMISLQLIYETLLSLRDKNIISKFDVGNFMGFFEQFFNEHFGSQK